MRACVVARELARERAAFAIGRAILRRGKRKPDSRGKGFKQLTNRSEISPIL
jgi:hypothetical protein